MQIDYEYYTQKTAELIRSHLKNAVRYKKSDDDHLYRLFFADAVATYHAWVIITCIFPEERIRNDKNHLASFIQDVDSEWSGV